MKTFKIAFLHASLLGCVLLSGLRLPALAAESGAEPTQPGVDILEVVFDQNPVELGLTFDRRNVSPANVDIKGQTTQVWKAGTSLDRAIGWAGSFRFKVTDERFQQGGRPAVDIEITYHLPSAWTGPVVKADTRSGGRLVGQAPGRTGDFRTARFRVNDAFFGARDHKSTEQLPVDGFDLRIDGNNNGFYLRRVRIIGYDPKENVVWPRMLGIDHVSTDAAGGVFVFPRTQKQQLSFALRNSAFQSRAIHYNLEISDHSDKVTYRASGDLTLNAESRQNLPFNFDSSAWPLGPYDGNLSLYLDKNATTPVVTGTFRLGIRSDAVLPKARQGEFLYGLDTGFTELSEPEGANALAFFRLMGVDILRNLDPLNRSETVDNVTRALAALSKQNLQAALIIDPPKDADAAQRAVGLATKTRFLEEVARRYAGRGVGKIQYWEMGNEPDLPGFYAGPMAEYIESYHAMYDAIKRGARAGGVKPNDTIVMNGGLSFAGPIGDKRSREFLQLVDANKLDAIGYHGHGPGIEAERSALERVRAAAAKEGKANRLYVQTESGVSGGTRAGLQEQARTVVEKMVYAQSQGVPAFMFFRLFMNGDGHEGGYGLTDNRTEPRPSILSYRNMVERLRHHQFLRTIDFAGKASAEGVSAFLFEERAVNGKATGRKTLVAFSEKTAQYDLTMRLDTPTAVVRNASTFDLYGNARPTTLLTGNIATLRVGVDAVYVSWTSPSSDATQVMPPLLGVQSQQTLLAGAENYLTLTAHNPANKPLQAQIIVESHARLPLKVTPVQKTVALKADGAASIELRLALGKADALVDLPKWWKVFPDIDAAKVTPQNLATMPGTMPGANGPVTGQFVMATQNRLDLAKIAGGFGSKRAALAVAYIDSPLGMALPVAASADWWMAWYLNGEKVFDTLEEGNNGRSLADLTFNLPLRAGRNTIAALVLSGSQGWRLEFGGLKERFLAQNGADPDRLVVSMQAEGRTLAQKVVPLQLSAPLPALGQVSSPDSLQSWMPLQPLAQLDDAAVTNFWFKEPDQSRWYRGLNDLSALAWLRESGQEVHLFVAVRDDKLVQAPSASSLKESDSLHIVFARDNGPITLDVKAGLVNGKTVLTGNNTKVGVTVNRDETGSDGPRTLYHFTVPKPLLGNQPFHVNLNIVDNDDTFVKQQLQLGNVESPQQGLRVIAP
jgi:hypothetical protein